MPLILKNIIECLRVAGGAHPSRLRAGMMAGSERNLPNPNAATYSSLASSWLLGDPGTRRVLPVLALLTVMLLVPFAGKAFHIDDTLFLKAAHQISAHPFDPYGFSVNWFTTEEPMADVMQNPPLASYYIAAVAAIFGWSEIALHLAFVPFAIAVVLGTYALARRCAAPPVLSALAVLLSPIFLVSSTNVMCDTMMLSMFIWAVVLWIDGITHGSSLRLMWAFGLVALAVLAKYFAVSALLLMAAYAISRRRLTVAPILAIVLSLIVILGYELWTASLYGRGLLSDAVDYANLERWQASSQAWAKSLVGLGFVGAVLPSVFLFAPRLFPRRAIVGAILLAFVAAPFVVWGVAPTGSPPPSWENKPLLAAELALLIAPGLMIFFLGVTAWRPGVDPEAMLLGLWVLGTFAFGCFINWSVNARAFMPLGPPAAILLARRLAARGMPSVRWIAAALIAAALLSIAVCWGDYRLAGAGRDAAARVMSLPRSQDATVWFQGHWGFQHYMEERGAKAFDTRAPYFVNGDLVVIPHNNSTVLGLNLRFASSMQLIELPANRWVTTLSAGAGFYAHVFGPLPFVFGPVPLERYSIATFRQP